MYQRFLSACAVFALAAFAVACGGSSDTSTTNTTANTNAASTTTTTNTTTTAQDTRVLPDGSEVRTETVEGVKTETRTFTNAQGRIERVVVRTDASGRRTARVHYRAGEVRELPESQVESALTATGDALVDAGGVVVEKGKDAAGAVADKTEDAAGAVRDKGGDVVEATGEGVKAGAEKTADGARAAGRTARKVGDRVVDETKEGAKKTAEGAKKVGNKVKDAITP